MSAPDTQQKQDNGLLRMRELAEASGVPAPTIKHYLREGLLPEPVKTSRNMAYYPPEFGDRIKLIKRLQEEKFLPLKAIKDVLEQRERSRTSAAEVRKRYGVPKEVLGRLAQLRQPEQALAVLLLGPRGPVVAHARNSP